MHFQDLQLKDAHSILDGLDVPQSKSGAFIGHRWYWCEEGKRESYKTKENTEGYSLEKWKEMQQRLKDVQSGKIITNEKANARADKLNILDDNGM